MNQFSAVTWYNMAPYAWGLTGIEVSIPSQDNINCSVSGKKTYCTVPYIASSLDAATFIYACLFIINLKSFMFLSHVVGFSHRIYY